MTDSIEQGRQALLYFYNASKKYSGFNYTFDQMVELIAGSPKSVQFLFDGLGTAIISIQDGGFLLGSKVKTAMENLANTSKGKVPNRNSFFGALSAEAQDVTFIEAIPSVVSGTLSEIGTGLQTVGDSLLDTGKILTMIFPFAAIGAILFIFTSKVKKVAK